LCRNKSNEGYDWTLFLGIELFALLKNAQWMADTLPSNLRKK